MSKLEECKEFCKLINLRDSMAYLRGRASKEYEKTLNDLNKLINDNFDTYFGDKSEYKMRYNKAHNHIVVKKKPYEVFSD